MICNNCGRIIANDAANFCEYCGAPVGAKAESFGDSAAGYADMNYSRYGSSEYGQAGYDRNMNSGSGDNTQRVMPRNGIAEIYTGTAGLAETERSMSFTHWLAIMILPMIPAIGGLCYFVLLLVWSFGKTASVTRKNWARAMLIMFVVMIFYLTYMISGLVEAGFDFNQLMGTGV